MFKLFAKAVLAVQVQASILLPNTLNDPAVNLEKVATISAADFHVGRQWRWNYFDGRDVIYSVEQYTVIESKNGVVLIEMSTHFPNETVFKPHHRIQVNIADCLNSYADPLQKRSWSMRMFFLDKGVWRETTPPSPLAFEEKFNCNPYKHDSNEFLTVFRQSPAGELFMQQRWRRLESSWYMNVGPHKAVSYEKEFPHGAGGETYHCRFDSAN